ncbi:MAG: EamA family transporter [Moraxellaceae bacterium]|nr:EamA family transporter [Moraxellaceae bacterium]
MNNQKTQLIATGIGFIAILLWSSLALFTAISDGIPVFQLMALTFAIGATTNMIGITLKGEFSKEMFLSPPKAWLLSVGGIYLYHFFYFEGIFNAPPEQSSLINYLWPLFIVLFSAFLPKGKLHWYTILGAVVSFWGVVALLMLKEGGNFQLDTKYLLGYLFAFGASITWGIYSVANRLFAHISSSAVVGYCYWVALFGLLTHFATGEQWVSPSNSQWVGIVCLGLAPVGLSFLVWDFGTKRGNIQLLGILSYFAPLLSTILLIIFTPAKLTTAVVVGCGGIVLGAIIAVFPSIRGALFKK